MVAARHHLQKQNAESSPALHVPSTVTFSEVQKQASGATARMATRTSSTGTTIAATAPKQSDGITQFREGLQHIAICYIQMAQNACMLSHYSRQQLQWDTWKLTHA